MNLGKENSLNMRLCFHSVIPQTFIEHLLCGRSSDSHYRQRRAKQAIIMELWYCWRDSKIKKKKVMLTG